MLDFSAYGFTLLYFCSRVSIACIWFSSFLWQINVTNKFLLRDHSLRKQLTNFNLFSFRFTTKAVTIYYIQGI